MTSTRDRGPRGHPPGKMKAIIISILTGAVLVVAALSWVMMNPARSLTVQVLGSEPAFEAMLASAPRELQEFRIYWSPGTSVWMFSTVAGSAAEADRRIDELETLVREWAIAVKWENEVKYGSRIGQIGSIHRIDGHWDYLMNRHHRAWKFEPYP